MHRFVGKVKTEGFFSVRLVLEKLNGTSSQQRGDVTVLRHSLAVVIDCVFVVRGIILPLSLEAKPVVKTWAGLIVCPPHVPLADKPGGVSRLLEILWKKERPLWNQTLIVDHPVAKSVQPGKDRRPTRRTERSRHKCVLKMRSVGGHRIHVRRLCKGVPHETHRIVAMIVRKNENNIPRLGSRNLLRDDRLRNVNNFPRRRNCQNDTCSNANDVCGDLVHS